MLRLLLPMVLLTRPLTTTRLDPEIRSDNTCECGVAGPQARTMTRDQLLQFMEKGEHQKIVGGSLALPGEFPWIVTLEYYGHYYCGGSIISSR